MATRNTVAAGKCSFNNNTFVIAFYNFTKYFLRIMIFYFVLRIYTFPVRTLGIMYVLSYKTRYI